MKSATHFNTNICSSSGHFIYITEKLSLTACSPLVHPYYITNIVMTEHMQSYDRILSAHISVNHVHVCSFNKHPGLDVILLLSTTATEFYDQSSRIFDNA